MIRFFLLASLAFPRLPLPEPLPPPTETIVWIWDAECIKKVDKGKGMWMEAPNVGGHPDMNKLRVYGVVVDYIPSCGRIEIRKKPSN